MTEPFQQNLPSLAEYRRELIAEGAPATLPHVPFSPAGLLAQLPPAPDGRTGWPWTSETPPFATAGHGASVEWPLFTIVTPSFRQADFLEETIRSVLLQNYPRLEFIVMDGDSPDASPAVIEKYRPWLSYARVARDRGQSNAINLGFSLAADAGLRGWINSDDFYLPGTLRRVAEASRRGGDFFYGDGLELIQSTGQTIHLFSNLASGRYVKFGGLVPQVSTFWLAERHQPLWEEQHCALDYELWIRLLPGLGLRHLGRPLAVARRHAAAKTYDPAMKHCWDEDARRNGLAHPRLYVPNFQAGLLAREYRIVQRLWRVRHGLSLAKRLESVRRECRWDNAPTIHA